MSPLNIPHFIVIFAKHVPHAVNCVFHSFMELPISLIIFLLTPCSFIALNIRECGTELQAFW